MLKKNRVICCTRISIQVFALVRGCRRDSPLPPLKEGALSRKGGRAFKSAVLWVTPFHNASN